MELFYIIGLNLFIHLTFDKWCMSKLGKLVEKYDIYKKKWMPERCSWCFFFWASLITVCIITPFSWAILIKTATITVLSDAGYRILRRYL